MPLLEKQTISKPKQTNSILLLQKGTVSPNTLMRQSAERPPALTVKPSRNLCLKRLSMKISNSSGTYLPTNHGSRNNTAITWCERRKGTRLHSRRRMRSQFNLVSGAIFGTTRDLLRADLHFVCMLLFVWILYWITYHSYCGLKCFTWNIEGK